MVAAHPADGLSGQLCRRKVKCDKKKPCDGCSKAGVECVYPMGRASRRQGTPDPELTNRLKRLEDVVRRLGSFIGEEGIQQALQTAPPQSPHGPQQSASASDNNPSATPPPMSMEQDRYEKPQKLGGKHDTAEDPGYDADFESLESHVLAHNFDSIFGNSTAQPGDICTLHPTSGAYRWKMWSLYKQNVHPVVSLFHLPSLEQWFHESTEVAFGIPRNMELAMFCIYYGAVTSIDDEDCQSLFDMERSHLLARYRLGVEKCLVRAGFMDTDDRLVLEALCAFLIILRRHDARLSWKLSGLAIRLSQSVGIHRDGYTLHLPFFEAEMRRRLAWQLCNIDAPAQEDYACDPSMLEMSSFDAGMPINVSAMYVRCMHLELKLNVFKPLQNPARFNTARRNELFLCSLECIEASYRLQHDRRSEKWAWFFKSYNQWHALAFVLHELRERRAGSSAGNAWRAVERVMASRWETPCENYRGGHQWNTILRMWEAARAENRKVMRSPHQDIETSIGGLRPSSAALTEASMSRTPLKAPAFTTASSDPANAMSLSGGTRCSGVDFQEYAPSEEMPSFPKQASFSMIDIEESPEDRYSTVFSDKTLVIPGVDDWTEGFEIDLEL
ncbi:Transcription factor vrtR1 [Colletotrichum siamense]|uniref:Transcription factor vrtR1 n=1 Tax=Colletotrichum siamense TaxID=690259 RepID=UPI001872D8D5|nr:Transcription factor vrtR1 [Colletotrichum siamense]KAF5496796.1 Transcription factor vrtR1 [Colletotrichum siamense]